MAGLYIHVPFCAKRCLYCDFFSNTDAGYVKPYLSALVREMELRKGYIGGEALETVYFGGGTPSRLCVEDLGQIMEAVGRCFDLSQCKEITLEVNPDDMTEEYVQSLRALPFNRISMGVQSFDDDDLRFLNRRHNGRQAVGAVELCKANGFSNISIDLIYGLPGQTAEKWAANLEQALRLDVPHISAYHLTYEEGTALHRLLDRGEVTPTDEETSLALFSSLKDTLTREGYLHYEISNFARPGFISRHNSAYWRGENYVGLGPSAHSYDGESREWNVSSLPLYLKGIAEGGATEERETLNVSSRYNEFIITRLRTMWGVGYADVLRLFGEKYLAFLQGQAAAFLRRGLLDERDGGICLSGEGCFVSDGVMRELLWVSN
ncbi:Oxygen-independent coproporphyrinogen-III oxidase [Bacteroidales bacterium Barb6]|nr:Oxygen-independent coproporphyrinogen-III oxidase [Bacteroidales bacterium Barb6]